MASKNLLLKIKSLESVLQEFQCPVCMDYMVPPIISCVSGHNFCYRCDRKLGRCPICKSYKSDVRNLGMEKIFNNLIVPCMNRHQGCTYEALGSSLKEHQKFCEYRILRCPLRVLNNCTEKGLLKNFLEHCIAKHTVNVFCTNTMQINWPRFRYTTILRQKLPGDSYNVICHAYGELFKCIWDMDMDTGFMRWCVVYMGPKSNLEKYSFDIVFENKENPFWMEKPIRLHSCCHPDHEVLFQKNKYLLTHVDMVRKLCGLHGLYFTITILKEGVLPYVSRSAAEDEHMQSTHHFVTPDPSTLFDLNDPALVEMRRVYRELRVDGEDDRLDDTI